LVEGNPGRRPLNEHEPEYDLTSLKAPIELDDIGELEWYRVAPLLQEAGVLTDVDRAVLAGYCAAYSTFHKAELALSELAARDTVFNGLMIKTKSGNLIQNPLVGIRNTALEKIQRFSAELGMTPSSRSRIVADKPFAQRPRKRSALAEKYGI
jgi:P27 family predicted phage terminase small subunit